MILTEIPIGRETIPFIVKAIKEFDNLNIRTMEKTSNSVKVYFKNDPSVYLFIRCKCSINMFTHREVLISIPNDNPFKKRTSYPYLTMDELREAIKKHIEWLSSLEINRKAYDDDMKKTLEEDKAREMINNLLEAS